jgi:hypothetical protein
MLLLWGRIDRPEILRRIAMIVSVILICVFGLLLAGFGAGTLVAEIDAKTINRGDLTIGIVLITTTAISAIGVLILLWPRSNSRTLRGPAIFWSSLACATGMDGDSQLLILSLINFSKIDLTSAT